MFDRRFLQLEDSETASKKEQTEDAIAEAKRSNKKKVIIPPEYLDLTTMTVRFDMGLQTTNISFQRPFIVNNSYGMDFNYSYPDYKMYLNWGVFKDDNDESTDQIYGARDTRDILNFTFLEPTRAMRVAVGSLVGIAGVLITNL